MKSKKIRIQLAARIAAFEKDHQAKKSGGGIVYEGQYHRPGSLKRRG